MKEVVEENGGKPVTGLGCFWIPNLPGTELFFCFDREDSGISPYLFHYSYKGRGTVNDRLQKVLSMTVTEAKLRGDKTVKISKPLQIHLQWIRSKWKDSIFEPSKYCRVTKKEGGGTYLLTCSPDNSTNLRPWREVPKGQVEVAKPQLMETA
ncbi:hypothetical protein WEN_00660 [Mycoplasma wenyonii str. Massachusetts]|uniref:Uncharacterized protein n=1 Tax=Mycoplasma wenyonii (strain Massachusetts) TaxID=1197325 RepID=I6ZED0_MYCWM|nr:hypothetical protein [Mycoplasma wenyonii]AFN64937.1 hypothetical protein WEN_00660 [Mycoplasma wenyonii str. Massachusetts]